MGFHKGGTQRIEASAMMEDMQGLGLLFMDEGARCEGFMMGRIKIGGETRELEEHQSASSQA